MKELGSTKTYELVTDLRAMPTFVECVQELPDPNTVPVGSIFRLISSQKGFTAMHYYLCESYDGIVREWCDITEDKTVVEDTGAHATMKKVYHTNSGLLKEFTLKYSGFSHTRVDGVDDVFSQYVLVGNQNNPPTNVEDGTVLFSSVDPANETSGYPVAASSMYLTDDVCFRLFHVFKSGYTTYTDVVVS